MWIDNFNKNYANNTANPDKGPYTPCNWTGVALQEYINPDGHGDQKSIEIIDGEPAMDDTLSFLDEQVAEYITDQLPRMSEKPWTKCTSFTDNFIIDEVPIRLRPQDGMSDHLLNKLTTSQGKDGLKYWHPDQLLPDHVGSNIGLMRILGKLCPGVEDGTFMGRNHMILNSDCNIYLRVQKVLSLVFAELLLWWWDDAMIEWDECNVNRSDLDHENN